MQWGEYKGFVSKIVQEGQRLQKVNIAGIVTTKKRFTHSQKACIILSFILTLLLPNGISDNFAEYAIAFLGIFVGLFTSIIVAMYDKSKDLYANIENKSTVEQARVEMSRNYLMQFTGLTAYSIILALVAVVLLLGILLFPDTKINIWEYHFVWRLTEVSLHTVVNFGMVLTVSLFRIVVFDLLLNFFAVTLFSLSSYFSFLLAEYKKLGMVSDKS